MMPVSRAGRRKVSSTCPLCGVRSNAVRLPGRNIVSETPAAEGDAVLALAKRHALEFLDLVTFGSIIRIDGKNRDGTLLGSGKLPVGLE